MSKSDKNIGDTSATPEDILLQDRIVRIILLAEDSNVAFLYFNDDFPENPPSTSLFSDEDDDPNYSEIQADRNRSKADHNMHPKLVVSKIIEDKGENVAHSSVYIEDIVTRVYLPSEEFAQVVVLRPLKRFFSRLCSWCKTK